MLSRYPLWQEGIDYKCGTGHGVGFLLNVHEGPHGFAMVSNTVVLEKGMIITIEPGVYKGRKSWYKNRKRCSSRRRYKTDSGQFMKFDTISFVPIDLEGIDVSLLSESERLWLNEYHKEVYNNLSSHLTEEEKAWLKRRNKTYKKNNKIKGLLYAPLM